MRRPSFLVAVLAATLLPVSACAASPRIGEQATSAVPPSASVSPSAPSKTLAGAVSSARFPSDVLDLRNWYLTLPTGAPGHPDTVNQPQLGTYASSYFQLDPAKDGVVFTADAGGATTVGSRYPRSELREMNGDLQASWSNTSGSHTMTVRQAVVALPTAKPDVVTAQIHDTQSDVVEIRLQGRQLIAQYDNGKTNITLDPAYVLGTRYDLRIVAASSHIAVFYNGVQKADIDQSGSGWYFKSGSYVQSNPSKGERPDAVGVVVIYGLTVSHTG